MLLFWNVFNLDLVEIFVLVRIIILGRDWLDGIRLFLFCSYSVNYMISMLYIYLVKSCDFLYIFDYRILSISVLFWLRVIVYWNLSSIV